MAKQTIQWHEECLKNFEASTARMAKAVEQGQKMLAAMQEEVKYRKAQIEEAKRLGKPDFDQDKFLKSEIPAVRYWTIENPRWL